jgi:lipid-A-disaccharide synthase
MPKKIFISAGEASGDLHGSNLVKEIKALYPDVEFFGIGGERMKQAGVKIFFDLSSLAYMGLWEVFKHLFRFRNIFNFLINEIKNQKPDLAVLIDYPSFNLRLAKQIHRLDIPVVYYISPQIWAWGKKRIELIRKYVTKMVVFFDFEKDLYEKGGIDVEFAGHPLLDVAKPELTKDEFVKLLDLDASKITVAILPGSRKKEVQHMMRILLDTAEAIYREAPNTQFVIAKYPELPKSLFEPLIKKYDIPVSLIDNRIYDVINISDFAIVKSGTGTLETAVLETPMIIVYRTSFISAFLSKIALRLPYIGMINVIAGKLAIPEFVQYNARPRRMADEILSILKDRRKYSSIKKDLAGIKKKLGEPGGSGRAAKVVADMLKK